MELDFIKPSSLTGEITQVTERLCARPELITRNISGAVGGPGPSIVFYTLSTAKQEGQHTFLHLLSFL